MAKIILALALAAQALVPTRTALKSTNVRANARSEMTMGTDGGVVLIGVAADSGCGKSTFMRRLTGIFGGTNVGPARRASSMTGSGAGGASISIAAGAGSCRVPGSTVATARIRESMFVVPDAAKTVFVIERSCMRRFSDWSARTLV